MHTLAHQPVFLSFTAGCRLVQGKIELVIIKDHPNTHGCLTSLRNKPQKKYP